MGINPYIYLLDKGIALDFIKNHNVEMAIKHYDMYLEGINKHMEEEPDNLALQEDLSETKRVFLDGLFTEVRESFNHGHWTQTLYFAKLLLGYGFEDPSLYKFLSFCFKELNQQDTRLAFIKKYGTFEEIKENDYELGKLLAEAYLDNMEVEEEKAKRKNDYTDDALRENGDIVIKYLEKYLEAAPEDPGAWHLMAHVYANAKYDSVIQLEKQNEYYEKAFELEPNNLIIMKNLALSYVRSRMYDKAEELYKQIFASFKDPFTSDDHFNYAAYKLKAGDYIDGFIHYERRMDKENSQYVFVPEMKKPRWNGYSDISDKTLLVHLEQGFGDVVMFIRFVKQILPYAKKVIAIVQDQLYSLFWESNLGFDIYSINDNIKDLKFDYHIPLISLPRILKTVPETVPDRDGYLDLDPQRVADYKTEFINDNDKIKIGVNLEGAGYAKKQARDVDWKYIKEIAKLENVELYCFNKEKNEDFFKEIDPDLNIVCLGSSFRTFADTAAAIKNMDVMISTDNVILNLCGALNKRTFAPLNFDYEYRWYNAESGKVVWYNSVSTYVNEVQNDWEPTMYRLIDGVREYIKTLNKH